MGEDQISPDRRQPSPDKRRSTYAFLTDREDVEEFTTRTGYFLGPFLEKLEFGDKVKEVSYVDHPKPGDHGEPAHQSITLTFENGNKVELQYG